MRCDIMEFSRMFTEDCRLRIVGNPMTNPTAGEWVGRVGVQNMLVEAFANITILDGRIVSMLLDGDQACVLWNLSMKIHGLGRVVTSSRCDHLILTGTQVRDVTHFFDTASTAVFFGRLAHTGAAHPRFGRPDRDDG